ncbi:hypothetical protein ES705_34620 [subsurface metagenome]
MSKVFERVQNLRPGKSVFNLSYEKKFNCDMGQLIPTMCDEVVPGDVFQIGNEIVIRLQPLVAPVLHEINAYVHYFFVPNRILFDGWEDFITGGIDGEDSTMLPTWVVNGAENDNGLYSLWDYFGLPIGVVPTGRFPLDFPKRAYNLIFNEYYRDETLIPEVNIETSECVLIRCWEKDYFGSALPWQQRGIAPALPISGMIPLDFSDSVGGTGGDVASLRVNVDNTKSLLYTNAGTHNTRVDEALSKGVGDISGATTFNVADLRLAFQIQKWMERNARSGARYKESLMAHFGEAPRDERLQRPEYIGGSKSSVIISEVLQTSQTEATGTPQGTLAGHGITADRKFIAKYRAKEHGWIIGIMSIMPRAAYQQGIDKQWLRETKYDYYFPEFANLSEQAIERVEIYASAVENENKTIFGYQGRYDEMRVKRSMVCGDMRDLFSYWHLGRIFESAPELNESFLRCVPDKRIFAVQDEPGFIVNVANIIKAVRPMPIQASPGLIDH